MTAQSVKTQILPELIELYQRPFGVDDDNRALKAYVESLKDVPEAALTAGWRDIKRDHTSSTRPTIGAILEACRKHYPQTAETRTHRPGKRECFATPQGQLALAEGHGVNFYHTCWQRKRVMTMQETQTALRFWQRARTEWQADERLRNRFDELVATMDTRESDLRARYLRADNSAQAAS